MWLVLTAVSAVGRLVKMCDVEGERQPARRRWRR
jgi:hypothetical protein